jgi:hypothetical protein
LEFKAQYGGLYGATKGCHDGIEPYFLGNKGFLLFIELMIAHREGCVEIILE